MAFNFFQKNKKDSHADNGRGSKETIPEKSSTIFGSTKRSDVSLISKKEDSKSLNKSSNVPQNMVPHISEKSSNLLSQNSYVFKIEKNLNKVMVEKAIENHYSVKVVSVRILNGKPKKIIRGNIVGKKSGYKKAIVQLKEGHKIEF